VVTVRDSLSQPQRWRRSSLSSGGAGSMLMASVRACV
jgi:hypothetical protein